MRFQQTRYALTIFLCAGLVGLVGCDDFATPAELDRPQILGIAAEPPAVALGGTTTLSIYVADPAGEVVDPEVMWEVVPLNQDRPPIGQIDATAAVPTFLAPIVPPMQVPEEPILAMVQATVSTSAGPLLGQKVIVIGSLTLANPTLSQFAAGNTDLLVEELHVARGVAVSLEVGIEPAADKDTTYSWYSTIGTIDAYRSAPAELVAPDEAGSGWLFVVVRNGRGGIVWRKARVHIE